MKQENESSSTGPDKDGASNDKNLKWDWSELRRKADWWAVWIGLAIILAGMVIYFPYQSKMELKINKAEEQWRTQAFRTDKVKTIAWYKLTDAKQKAQAMKEKEGKAIAKFTGKPHKWKSNPLHAFIKGKDEVDAGNEKAAKKLADITQKEKDAYEAAVAAEQEAEAAAFENDALNANATTAITSWRNWYKKKSSAAKKAKAKPYNQIPYLIGLLVFLTLLLSVGIGAMGKSVVKYIKGFWFVFILTVLAIMLSQQSWMKTRGIGYAAWAIVIGLFISNVIKVPKWAKPAIQSEYYIKIGLVLLGAKILFSKLVSIGIPGIFVAWVVTPIVLLTTYWFGQRVLKMASKSLNITIAADMSVCGVSAAIAVAAACKAKKEELTLAIGLSISFTAIMMVVMPVVIKAVFPGSMVEVLGGAWIGGTIDATGAVAASGAFLGERALYVAATIKMIQNILIGVIAFLVAIYWTTKIEGNSAKGKINLLEIWYRFPKFVLGFIFASVLLSVFYAAFGPDLGYALVDKGLIKGMTDIGRGWFFALAFLCIGLETNFKDLAEYFKGGKPLILYLSGQGLNLILTLLMAYLMFYVMFPSITAGI
jgi:uncharacterized membrane protein YadS